MARFLTALVLVALAIAGFFMLTKPLYGDVMALRAEAASYDAALSNAKSLEAERDKLTEKYNAMSPENLTKLGKLVPDNVDNIRLILEIGKIALPYGMILKEVKYDTPSEDPNATVDAGMPEGDASALKDYGSWSLEFTTTGNYDNFMAFLKDLQSNLRIVDISSIDFSSDNGTGAAGSYAYHFKIRTYWLKN
ncbi:MAG: hypothetical protein WDN09_02160 [bacterium]